MRKTLKFDNYKIKCRKIKTDSNYDLSVQLFFADFKLPEAATILKSTATDQELFEWAFYSLQTF